MLVTDSSDVGLSAEVDLYLEEGWDLYKGPGMGMSVAATKEEPQIIFFQAVTKKEQKNIESSTD